MRRTACLLGAGGGATLLSALLLLLLLLSSRDSERGHELLARGRGALSEFARFRLLRGRGALLARCAVAAPAVLLATNGGINVAAELAASCPATALLVLRYTVLSVGVDGASDEVAEAPTMEQEAALASAARLGRLHIAHLDPVTLRAAVPAQRAAHIALLRLQLVVLQPRGQASPTAGADFVELDASPLLLLRAALPGGNTTHSHLRVSLISDSQSGTATFRHLLSHIAARHALPPAAERARRALAAGSAKPGGNTLAAVTPRALLTQLCGGGSPAAADGVWTGWTPLDLLIHGGDAVQSSTDAREAALYLLAPLSDLYASLGYAIPIILVRGNHDDALRTAALTLPPPAFRAALADAAADAQPSSPVLYTALQFGAALRILVTDSSDESAAQTRWVDGACAHPAAASSSSSSSGRPLTLALSHVPPFTEYWDAAAWAAGESAWGDAVRERLLPQLRCCAPAVDVLVSGHSHIYQRGRVPAERLAFAPADEADAVALCPSSDGGGAVRAHRRRRPLLATIGGGGGALESGGVNHVAETGAFRVTAFEHHFAELDVDVLPAPVVEAGGGRVAVTAVWRAIAASGELLDELSVLPLDFEG